MRAELQPSMQTLNLYSSVRIMSTRGLAAHYGAVGAGSRTSAIPERRCRRMSTSAAYIPRWPTFSAATGMPSNPRHDADTDADPDGAPSQSHHGTSPLRLVGGSWTTGGWRLGGRSVASSVRGSVLAQLPQQLGAEQRDVARTHRQHQVARASQR